MASFFRKRIAQKVLGLLQQKHEFEIPASHNVISSLVKVNRSKSIEPKLILPWENVEQVCNKSISVSASDVLRILRNQGIPTAEGFIDIELFESPLSLVFTVDKHVFSKIVLLDIFNNEDNLAKTSCLFEDIAPKNIVVQCSVPCMGEPLHLTHFRSIIHSNYVTNINRFAGHNVVKVAHMNDWGLDIAAFLTGYKQFSTEQVPKKRGTFYLSEVMKAALLEYKNNLKFIDDVNNCYKQMLIGDPKVMADWQNLQQLCMDHYDIIFKRLNVNFDDIHFDSSCHHKFEDVTSKLLDSNIISCKDGRIKLNSSDDLIGNEYADNISNIDHALYDLSRYITAATEMKQKYNFDTMHYVAPSSIDNFLTTLFYLIKRLNFSWSDELHLVSLKLITSFETKRRKKESFNAVIDQVKDNMTLKLHENLQLELNESLEEMAEHLSLSSLIVNDFKHKRKGDYTFKWEDILSLKKDTGAAFQLCYAGLKELQNSEVKITDNTDTSALLEAEAHYLIQHLARFDEMVYKSYLYLEPRIIYQYLYTLWYFTDIVTNVIRLDTKHDRLRVIKARLLLLSATLKIFNKGLHLLGITPFEHAYSPDESFVTDQQ